MTTSFSHSMPFGAELTADGAVRFRLWAPGQPEMAVVLGGSDLALAMDPIGDGWFELVTDRARPGSTYQFVMPDGLRVPDPASRAQQDDVNGPSLVIDPASYGWRSGNWNGRPWEDAVLYELHVGAFGNDGTFDGVRRRLDHLARTGITAIELMPVADFAGHRGWGYDGVLPFAPDRAYGGPDALKRLVDECHGQGLMILLDVVYNHFGPEGNYLPLLAPAFFTERHHTPWGAAIDFSRRQVRDFFIHNVLYWLTEYRFDGLRLDAVHAILDDSDPHILVELAETVRQATAGRQVHLVLENASNEARYLKRGADGAPLHYTAQWNDDYHHVVHVLLTGEKDGYYRDFVDDPAGRLMRALTEGFVYQGENSAHEGGAPRGEASGHLPPTAMVNFLQNHDQIGNRAMGERLTTLASDEAVRAALALLLLAPQIPMLFMGEEWGAKEPFLYFCDFHDQLADAVREGRRREFAAFARFAAPEAREAIPDPNAAETIERSVPAWPARETERLADVRTLLSLRRERIVPHLRGAVCAGKAERPSPDSPVAASWILGDGSRLSVVANLSGWAAPSGPAPAGDMLFETHEGLGDRASAGKLPPWSVLWCLDGANATGSAAS